MIAIMVSKSATKVGMSFGVAEQNAVEFPDGGQHIYVVARYSGPDRVGEL